MGSWGSGPFDNDDASDFLEGLSALTDPASVAMVLSAVLFAITSSDDYIEAVDMNRAMAAASVVAIMSGARPPAETPLQDSWLATVAFTPSVALRDEARRTFERGFEPDENEWFDLRRDASLIDEVAAASSPYRAALR